MATFWDFNKLSEIYGLPIIDRTYLPRTGRWEGLNVPVVDEADLPEGDKRLEYIMSRDDGDGTAYDLYRYKGKLIAVEVAWEDDPFEISAEDLAEWQAASSGVGYYTFIGQPWRD